MVKFFEWRKISVRNVNFHGHLQFFFFEKFPRTIFKTMKFMKQIDVFYLFLKI
jgi:hypothetical protein